MMSQKRLWSVLAAGFALLMFAGLALAFDYYYDLNDDTAIKDIVSGTYTGTPSGYCIQMLYPLGAAIALFYRAIPEISWYGLFLCLCQFGVLALIARRLLMRMPAVILILEALLVLALFMKQLVIMQYSITSGFCMAGAVFLYATGDRDKSVGSHFRENISAVILVLLAFQIRPMMCLMCFPFLLLAGLARWSQEEKIFAGTAVRKHLLVIAAALLGMLVCLSLDKLAYRAQDWQTFERFFDARTKLYDYYGIPDYEANQTFYEEIGLSRESYLLLQNYNFALDDSIDDRLLAQIVTYQENNAAQNGLYQIGKGSLVFRNSPGQALWLYSRQILSAEYRGFFCMLFVAYAGYLLLGTARKKSGCWWKVLLLVLIRSVLWIYLYMADRVLDRVAVPLFLMELVLLLAWIVQEIRQGKAPEKRCAVVLLLIGLCSIGLLPAQTSALAQEYAARETANERWAALQEYCRAHPENYYSIDVYSSTSYQGASYSEKLFAAGDTAYRNFDLCGGWVAKSPISRQKLAQMGLTDIEQALLSSGQSSGVYFVAAKEQEVGWLVAYYAARGQTVELQCIDEITTQGDTTAFLVYELM